MKIDNANVALAKGQLEIATRTPENINTNRQWADLSNAKYLLFSLAIYFHWKTFTCWVI